MGQKEMFEALERHLQMYPQRPFRRSDSWHGHELTLRTTNKGWIVEHCCDDPTEYSGGKWFLFSLELIRFLQNTRGYEGYYNRSALLLQKLRLVDSFGRCLRCETIKEEVLGVAEGQERVS